jgi:hypothetical protein
MPRRRPFLVLAAICLTMTSAAAADPADNKFTAVSTPSLLRPAATAYEISVTEAITGGPSPTLVVDDVIPPETTIDSGGPPSPTNQTSATFSFSSNEEGSTFECRLDAPAFSTCTSPASYTGLGVGLHVFEVVATDLAGNKDTTAASHSWTIDLAAPETSIEPGAPPTPTNQTSASFVFSSNEAGAKFECRLDIPTFSGCTSPAIYGGLLAGAHTFAVRATDPAGNTDATPATHSWTIDLTAPQTTIGLNPPPSTNSTSATFTFSSEVGATFECKLDSPDFSVCTSPKVYTGLHEGSHTFEVRAKDVAGNTDASPASDSWTIDLIGPATTIVNGPPTLTNSTGATFTFSSEAGTTFECSLDDAPFSACKSPHTYSDVGQGPHLFAVRAVDTAKNAGPASSLDWTIDTRPPTTMMASGPAALSNSRSATFAFSADEPSAAQCQLDGGSFQACGSPASYQGLGDGAHTFIVRSTDAVGNTGASSSYNWTIDATAPETTVTSRPRSGTRTASATFRFQANEPVTFECKLDGAVFSRCTSPKTYARLKKSRHSFQVRAIDAAGNVDATPAVHRWTIGAVRRTAKATSALTSPQAGARLKAPPLLRWRPVARASYYNVQLFRGRVKVLSRWPTHPSLRLRWRWTYLGRQRKLVPGTYRWYVWPAYSRNRYGRLLGQSTFVMTAR